MTIKQRILKLIYPLLMRAQRKQARSSVQSNPMATAESPVPFHSLLAITSRGTAFPFESLQGKYVLLVKTASECGYTPQYTALETLHQQYKDRLAVLGFPANNFGGQEPAGDEAIASFCQLNFGVRSRQAMKLLPVSAS
ncbi:MAG: hypothetical protein MUF29_01030 [Chitinophagaceae bacterium]|nr:hypothetical protein [Chitinophagaceae bacterium]